jgi:metal-responsive CopG/Arc/MetJ family transcriptional regulator
MSCKPGMPRTINGENRRQSVRIPVPMVEEIDRIVREHVELHYNRQQFIECAIREKIEKTQLFAFRKERIEHTYE